MSKGELEVAIAAARAGGEVLRRNYNTGVTVRYKGPVDLVTQVDTESERIVTGILHDAYPAYGILAEEGGGSAGEVDARWIVDPLDGTTNYAHAFPFFAVAIALERAGQVEVGVVYDPMRDELYSAVRGEGATCNGAPLRVSSATELRRSLVATGFPYDRAQAPAALELWGRMTLACQGLRRAGSAALDLSYVAAGRLDGYYERGIWAWDIAAGSLILTEAGGQVSNYAGAPLHIEGREIVATNGPQHAELVAMTSVQVR
ncbi:MAG: inositol monophosphatase [Chloroflexota bacterium]|nr:inositol monophosphatase [Chloroflexota bacterium]